MRKTTTRNDPTRALVDEIIRQYERREGMYRDAGGNPNESRFRGGELTAYIPHEMIIAVRRARAFEENQP